MSKKFSLLIFIFTLSFSTFSIPNTTHAENYLSNILGNLRSSPSNENVEQLKEKKNIGFGFFDSLFEPLSKINIFPSFGKNTQSQNKQTPVKQNEVEIKISENNEKVAAKVKTEEGQPATSIDMNINKNTGEISTAINTGNKVEDTKTNSYLNTILSKLGINNSGIQAPVSTSGGGLPAEQGNSAILQNPFLSGGQINPNSILGQVAGMDNPLSGLLGAFSGGGNPMQMFNSGANGILGLAQSICKENGGTSCDAGRAAANSALQGIQNATPYSGPGGSLPGDCGIPKGPIAYNIADQSGKGVRCNAKTIIVGYKGSLASLPSGVFGGGYITPLVPNFDNASLQKYGGQVVSANDGYGAKRFSNYNSQAAKTFIQEQLMHYKQQGIARGQKCVPVDIDNCDNVGGANYKLVLDTVEELNAPGKNGGVLIKVLTKNPQASGCNFFSHPAVVGAFIEEISLSDAQKVSAMRNKPEQILLFASGSGSKSPNSSANQKLKQIENLKIPNSAYSYDSGSEYQNIYDCTYNQ